MNKKIFATLIGFVLILSFTPVYVQSITTPFEPKMIQYSPDPVKVECWQGWQDDEIPEGAIPFNIDMVDVDDMSNDGEGIYVAVLDTGMLSNYLQFFPEDKVDIKEEWGKGFTHDVFYVGEGGSWDAEGLFDYGPLRDDRGFLTYDYGYPLWVYYPPDGNYYPFPFGSGHGTHVSSIVTGWQLERPDGNFWVRGVAPKVTIIPVLVLDDWIVYTPEGDGYWWSGGTDEMVAAGIRYIGDLAKEHGVKIIVNLSLGGSSPTPVELDAINYAIDQGVIIVASAGNEGYEGMGWPGAFPQVISVGAAGWTYEYSRYYTGEPDPWYWWVDDVPEKLWKKDIFGNKFQAYLTDFSSRPNPELGQEPWHLDVSAPGAGIKGPYKGYGSGDWGYYSVWGTSQAAPHVTGIAALLAAEKPHLSQYKMELLLKIAASFNRMTKWRETERSATIFDIFTNDLYTYSWGYLDYGTGLIQFDEAYYLLKAFRRW